jgi:hypothetical protein
VKTIVLPNTARALFSLVRVFGPDVKDEAFVFDRELPKVLASIVAIVHTGIRAVIAGRQWWGSTNWSAGRPRVAVLCLDSPIPHWRGLLSVEGDTKWDRLAFWGQARTPRAIRAVPNQKLTPCPLCV